MLTTGKLVLFGLCAGVYPGSAGVPWCWSRVPARWRACLMLFLAAGPFVPASLATTETAKLTAADGGLDDLFGNSVAISVDTMVVGATGDENHRGSAYVFVRLAGTWIQSAKLNASDGAGNDYFGWSVAVSGDTVVVSARLNDVGPNADQGSAYVFVKPQGGWSNMTQTAKLTAADGAAGDGFGESVAISGDTVVVGCLHDEIGANPDQGSTYVFVKPGSAWTDMTQTAQLAASDGAAGDLNGISVAISGETVVVGAHLNNISQGAAYVFVKPASGWSNMTQTAKLTVSDGAIDDQVGISVAISGDVIAVSSLFDNVGPNADQGSASVFVKPGGGWSDMTQTAKLTPADGATGDLFGRSVAVSGDIVVVWSLFDQVGPNQFQGSAYVFVKPGGGWSDMTQTTKLTASDGAADDTLGLSVAISGYIVVVGAYRDDHGATNNQGSAYVYDMAPVSPLAAPAPHDRSKNRYLSFTPNNPGISAAFRVQKTTAPTGSCWVQTPVQTASGVPAQNDQYTAKCGTAPVFRVWSEPVVHVGDCTIIPVADYEISATTDGAVFTSPLPLSTILLPSLNTKQWGDNVGVNNGTEWTPPNQFTNVNDVLSLLAIISGAVIRPHFTVANLQAISSADPCMNAFVNTADVLIVVKAVAGDAYPFTTNPVNCPACP